MIQCVASAAFEKWWNELVTALKPGIKIDHLSAHSERRGKYLDGDFTITYIDVGRNAIWITEPDAALTKEEFAKVFPRWRDYCKGMVDRKRIDQLTAHSTYVIGIMKWMDSK